MVNSSAAKAPANAPVYTDYRGISIGMTADVVRSKLDGVKKGNGQDFLALSEHESAQIYYDDKKKVTAISIDYIGDSSKAPTPETADRIEGFRAGIDAYLTKPFEPDELIAVVNAILSRVERTHSQIARLVSSGNVAEPSVSFQDEALTDAENRVALAVFARIE